MKEKGNFFKAIDKAEDICLVTMFILMVAAIFLQVIMRFIFNNSLTWSEELGKFIFVWISWLGISLAERKNEHIKITLVTDRLSPKWRTVCEIAASICVLLILGVIVYYGVELVVFQQRVHYAGIKISTSWGYLSLVLGCGFMMLRVIGGIIRNIGNLKSGNYPVVDTAEVAQEGGTK
ncbi:MAG: TRAP transporter small permease [Firmicutes bacterium]|nr:TRAP transporter small permease [Bacillota bacterium]